MSILVITLISINLVILIAGFADGSLQDEKSIFKQIDRFDATRQYLSENKVEIAAILKDDYQDLFKIALY